MDVCKIFTGTSNVLKGCGVLLVVTLATHSVGIGTTFWVKVELNGISTSRYHSGLFQMCGCSDSYFIERCTCVTTSKIDLGWLKGVQAFEIIGLLAIICVGFMIFAQLFFTQSTSIKIWGILLIAFAGISILGGVILYGAKMRTNLDYSFGFCVASAFLCFVCSVLLFQERRISLQSTRSADQIHYTNDGQIFPSPNSQVVISGPNQIQSPAYPETCAQYGPPPAYSVVMQQSQFEKNQNRF